MWKAVRNRVVEYPSIDWSLTAVIVLGHLSTVWTWDRFDILRTTGFTNRLSLYADMIATTGILVGFTATALASYLAFSGDRMVSFRAAVGDQVLRQWLSVITGLSVTIGVLVLCKILDRSNTAAAGVRWLAEGTLIFAAMRYTRMIWVYKQIVQVATTPRARRSRRAEPIGVRKAS